MQTCKCCGESKDASEYYVSNKSLCKQCTKDRVKANRLSNLEYYRAYDRNRGQEPKRVQARKLYAKTEAYRVSHIKANEAWGISDPRRRYATGVIAKLLKSGLLKRQPCLICGDKNSEGHHFDYGLPENVIWLCDRHHKDAHKIDKEINRQIAAYEVIIAREKNRALTAA